MTFSSFDQSKLDFVERILVFVFYCFLFSRMVHAYLSTENTILLIFLFDQFLILFFTLIRKKAAAISIKLSDWILAVLGTLFPLLMGPIGDKPLISVEFSVSLMFFGIALHLLAKLYLRRSFGIVPALREIKVFGPYRIIRHPIYAGYILVQSGLLLSGPTIYNFVIIFMSWLLFILRINAEEKILSQDPEYQKLVKNTPYRLIPKVY